MNKTKTYNNTTTLRDMINDLRDNEKVSEILKISTDKNFKVVVEFNTIED